jgi:hypothetical protein
MSMSAFALRGYCHVLVVLGSITSDFTVFVSITMSTFRADAVPSGAQWQLVATTALVMAEMLQLNPLR